MKKSVILYSILTIISLISISIFAINITQYNLTLNKLADKPNNTEGVDILNSYIDNDAFNESANYDINLSKVVIANNWTETALYYDWCYGKGTLLEPFIVENIWLENPDHSITHQNTLLNISNSVDYFVIINCTFNSSSGYSLYLNNVSNGIIFNNTFLAYYNEYFSPVSVNLENCSETIIHNNTIRNDRNDGLILNECTNIIISSNYILGDSYSTMVFSSINIILEINQFLHEVHLVDGNSHTIRNNIFLSKSFAIIINDCGNNTIEYNSFKDNSISIDITSNKNIIQYNEFLNISSIVVRLYYKNSDNVIHSNKFENNPEYYIKDYGNIFRNSVHHNIFGNSFFLLWSDDFWRHEALLYLFGILSFVIPLFGLLYFLTKKTEVKSV